MKSESKGVKRKDKISGDIPSGAIEITKDTPISARKDLVTSIPAPLPENFVKKQVDKKYGSWSNRGGK
jgi:hypothetical protein